MAGSKISTGDRVNDDIIIIQFAYIQIILILAYHYSLCNQGTKHIFFLNKGCIWIILDYKLIQFRCFLWINHIFLNLGTAVYLCLLSISLFYIFS